MRGIARHTAKTIGNFWVDLTRVTYYLLLPICAVYAVVLVSQGMIQNFKPFDTAALTEPVHAQVEKKNDKGETVKGPDGKAVMEDQVTDTQIDRARADGFADRDQDAWHKRRRLYQRQRRAALREPNAVLEFPPNPVDLRDSERFDLLSRPHG